MKLITEQNFQTNFITEENSKGGKDYFLEGVFMQAEVKNRNGRIYEENVLRPAVQQYIDNQVKTKRAVGELNHPNGPTVNYKEVSHTIESLEWDGHNVIGRAKILDTPNGQIVKALLDGGRQIGVSSRGMGSVTHKEGTDYISNDFILNTIDIVQDPSAPAAFVNGIMEGKEWAQQGDDFVEVQNEGVVDNAIAGAKLGLSPLVPFKTRVRINNKSREYSGKVGTFVKKDNNNMGNVDIFYIHLDDSRENVIFTRDQFNKIEQNGGPVGESSSSEAAKFLALRTFINKAI